jgi:hypothetical protein
MRAAIAILLLAGVSQAAEWKQLFDGKSLDGWSLVGPGRFIVEDGMLKTEGGMGLLWYTGQPFANTTIRVVFKTASPNANSGVYIRFPENPKTRGTPCTTATKCRSMPAGTSGTAPGRSTR